MITAAFGRAEGKAGCLWRRSASQCLGFVHQDSAPTSQLPAHRCVSLAPSATFLCAGLGCRVDLGLLPACVSAGGQRERRARSKRVSFPGMLASAAPAARGGGRSVSACGSAAAGGHAVQEGWRQIHSAVS